MADNQLHVQNFPFWWTSQEISDCLAEFLPVPVRVVPLKRGPYSAPHRRQAAFVHWAAGSCPRPEEVSGVIPPSFHRIGWTVDLVASEVRAPGTVSQLQVRLLDLFKV